MGYVILQVSDEGGVSVVRPEGKVDSTTAGEFEAAMTRVVNAGGGSLIVDLGNVTFMASAGLRVLLAAAKKLAQGDRNMRVFGLNGLVRETFEISGFITILDVRENETQAREGLA